MSRHRIDFLALGVRVRLEADSPRRLDALLDRVPCGWTGDPPRSATADCRLRWTGPGTRRGTEETPSRRPQRLLLDGKTVVTARRPDDLLDRFEHELLAAIVARTRRVVLHAGVVVYRRRAVLLPGRSFCGKSTLVQALVTAGGSYYSDDLAPIDQWGRVHAVPKRLALRQGARHASTVEAEELGWRPGCPPRPVGLIVLCRYRPAATFAPCHLSPGKGTLALFRHTVSAEAAPERAFRVLTGLASKVPVLVTDRGRAADTAPAILSRLSPGADR